MTGQQAAGGTPHNPAGRIKLRCQSSAKPTWRLTIDRALSTPVSEMTAGAPIYVAESSNQLRRRSIDDPDAGTAGTLQVCDRGRRGIPDHRRADEGYDSRPTRCRRPFLRPSAPVNRVRSRIRFRPRIHPRADGPVMTRPRLPCRIKEAASDDQ